eukprot:scaffold9673_cov105-Skeletonema_marinoi.AAC.1
MRRRVIYATIAHCHRPSCICICRQSDRADSEINLRNCTAITHHTPAASEEADCRPKFLAATLTSRFVHQNESTCRLSSS